MTNTKRRLSSICPQCSSQVERFIINIDCEISMCESKDCSYPFNEQSAEGLNIETPNTSFIRYSKKNNKASSLSNTVALPTPDDNNNAKSAKKARTGSYKPASSSSSEKKQKDQLNLTKSSDSDASVEEVIVAATSTAKTDLQINTPPQVNTNKEQSATSFSELSSFTPPPEVDYQDLKLSASSTASSSSTTTPTTITTTSPSTSSAMSIFDFSLPSPTSSIFNEALSNQLNHNITQKAPPPPGKAIDPTTPPVSGLCLPPMAAAKIAKVPSNNSPTTADYTLNDIESLLTVDNVNPSSLQNQTEELSWMEDYNDLFM